MCSKYLLGGADAVNKPHVADVTLTNIHFCCCSRYMQQFVSYCLLRLAPQCPFILSSSKVLVKIYFSVLDLCRLTVYIH